MCRPRYQVLGPGHLRRLGDLPAGIRSLDGGRAELGSATPRRGCLIRGSRRRKPPRLSARAARRRDPGIESLGRMLLSDCLLTSDVALDLVRARYNRRTA